MVCYNWAGSFDISCLQDKWLDLVRLCDIKWIFIIVGFMFVVEDNLLVTCHCPRCGPGIYYGLWPDITVHITIISYIYHSLYKKSIQQVLDESCLFFNDGGIQEVLYIFLWEYYGWSPEGHTLTCLIASCLWNITPLVHLKKSAPIWAKSNFIKIPNLIWLELVS